MTHEMKRDSIKKVMTMQFHIRSLTFRAISPYEIEKNRSFLVIHAEFFKNPLRVGSA